MGAQALSLLGLGALAFADPWSAAALWVCAAWAWWGRGPWLFTLFGFGLLCVTRPGGPLALSGVSFYVLPALAYVFDAQRGKPRRPAREILATLAFPFTLAAGPVTRVHALWRPGARWGRGLDRVAWGWLKKLLADRLAVFLDAYFATRPAGWLPAWTHALALAAQYYADFSGYSDMALGLAALFGVALPENFHLPYLATSVADHWRRWHMSLSFWFRDYVFTPMCLARWPKPLAFLRRRLAWRVGLPLVASMILIGLWHGLRWNNLWWGLYNAGLILASVALPRVWPFPKFRGQAFAQIALTFYLVLMGRVLTRVEDWDAAVRVWREMYNPERGQITWAIAAWSLGGLLVPHLIDACRPRATPVERRVFTCACVLLSWALWRIPRPFLYQGF